ncbi:MAG: cupin domain-containing protein [Gemmatimonadota bacterium]
MPHEITWELSRADARTFTGTAYTRQIGAADEQVPMKLYYVRFEPRARTFWHAHSGAQILVVCAGRCLYQREGEPVAELAAGESVRFEGGVRHWHGAGPDEAMEHIAVNLDPRETAWLDEVDEDEYGAA